MMKCSQPIEFNAVQRNIAKPFTCLALLCHSTVVFFFFFLNNEIDHVRKYFSFPSFIYFFSLFSLSFFLHCFFSFFLIDASIQSPFFVIKEWSFYTHGDQTLMTIDTQYVLKRLIQVCQEFGFKKKKKNYILKWTYLNLTWERWRRKFLRIVLLRLPWKNLWRIVFLEW